MLPDVDEQGWDDWNTQQFNEEADRKIASLAVDHQVNDRLSSLTRIGTWAAAPAPEAPPTPELPTPEPPPETPPTPEPAAPEGPPPGPVTPTAVPASVSPAPGAGPAVASPVAAGPASGAGDASAWENQVFGSALGAISQAGGDVQAFADRFGSSLRGARDAQSAFGQALGAAAASGADVQAFADRFQPPEKPAELSGVVRTPTGGVAAGVPQPAGGPLQDYARQAAARAGIDPDIFVRQIQQESGFNPNAGSPAGARGVAQIVPKYHPGVDTSDPYASLDYAASLMRSNLGKYGGDYTKALAAYNAGAGAVDKYGGVPPFEETQRYVRTILGADTPQQRITQGLERAGTAIEGANRVDPTGHTFPLIGYKVGSSGNNDPHATYHGAGGSDLMAARGTPVVSMGGGTVSEVMTEDPTRPGSTVGGNALVIRGDDGLDYYYAHLDGAPLIKSGDRVQPGQLLGAVGNTGNAWKGGQGETHLHIGIGRGISTGVGAEGGLGQNFDAKGFLAGLLPTSGDMPSDQPRVSPHAPDQAANPLGWLENAKRGLVDSLGGAGNVLQQGIIEPLRGALSLESTPEPRDRTLSAGVLDLDNVINQITGNANGGAAGTGAVPAPGSGFDPSALQARTAPPQPGIPLRQDIRDLGQAPQPTIFEQIGEAPGLSEADRAARREAVANAPVLGGALGMLRGPMLLTDQELLQQASPEQLATARRMATGYGALRQEPTDADVANVLRNTRLAEAYAGTHTGPAGGDLGRLAAQLDQYAPEIRQGLENFVRDQSRAGQPAAAIGDTVRQWMVDNPPTIAPSTVGGVEDVVRSLNRTIRGGGSAGPSGPQRGQLPLGMEGEANIPYGGARPFGGGEIPSGPQRGQLDLEGNPLPVGGPRPTGTEALAEGAQRGQLGFESPIPVGGPRPTGTEEMGAGFARGVVDVANRLKLPVYVPDSVRRIIARSWGDLDVAAQEVPSGKIDQQVLDDLAAAAKATPDRVKAVLRLDDPANNETAYALRQAFDNQASAVQRAQQVARDNPDSIEATRELVREVARQRALQETAAGVEGRASKALDQFRYADELKAMAGRFKMTEEEFTSHLRDVVDLSDPANVADLAKKAYGYTFKDKALAVWYFNLLSNPLTHIRNAVGNTTAALTAPAEGAGSALFDPLARKLLGDTGPRQRYIQEVPAEYAGLVSSLPDAARQGLRRMQLGVSDRATATERLATELTGPVGEALGGGLKNPINYPGRALAASDDFFRGANEAAALHGLANRVARQEGATGEALTNRIAELIKRPTQEMLDQVAETGAYRVFQNENAWASKINGWRGDSVAGRLLLPFVKTPLNLMGYALERSPVGVGAIIKDLATKSGRQALRENGGAGALADRMSRAAIGTAVWGALAKQAFDGNLTGALPSDPVERDAFRREGKQPFSFRNPVTGDWTSYQPLAPYSTLFGSAASVADAWRAGRIKNPDEIGVLGAQMAVGFAEGILDTQWTQQLTDALDIVNGNTHDPLGDINKFATRQAATLSPGFLRGFARATDDVLRDPQNPIEGLLAAMPGTQSMVGSQLNAWGQDVRRPNSGIEALLSPLNLSAPTNDPVELELRRLQTTPSGEKAFDVEPSLVGKNVSVLGQDTEMTDAQQRQYQQTSGYLAKAMLDLIIPSDEYKALPDGEKAKKIRDIYDETRKAVRESMQPGMLGQAVQARIREQQRQASVATPSTTAEPTPGAVPSPSPSPSGPRPAGPIRSGGPAGGGGPITSGGPVKSAASPEPRP